MKLSLHSVCQLALLALCCVLITVRESGGTFVPGRCVCDTTQPGVRGKLIGLNVLEKSPGCNKLTVIVTLKNRSSQVCLDPERPMAKQLIRCWKRVHSLGLNVKLCLKRRRRGRGGQRQRNRGNGPSPSN